MSNQLFRFFFRSFPCPIPESFILSRAADWIQRFQHFWINFWIVFWRVSSLLIPGKLLFNCTASRMSLGHCKASSVESRINFVLLIIARTISLCDLSAPCPKHDAQFEILPSLPSARASSTIRCITLNVNFFITLIFMYALDLSTTLMSHLA